ncbi:MAG TPA: hypothetical protein ENJ40_05305 [Thermosulfurimonas dismutans]|uniref:Uncharacterized protein n=1 Tax=Thermosulfurimonas dismutans TaxID=999894 RepID=A0A7C3GDZ6_9BACT|nr:hypothetical protein [Thermosulfurimonas dismutans]
MRTPGGSAAGAGLSGLTLSGLARGKGSGGDPGTRGPVARGGGGQVSPAPNLISVLVQDLGHRWTHYGNDLPRELFKEACRKAGIENPPTLYQAIRHSVAMDLLNSGYTYEAVARLLTFQS